MKAVSKQPTPNSGQVSTADVLPASTVSARGVEKSHTSSLTSIRWQNPRRGCSCAGRRELLSA